MVFGLFKSYFRETLHMRFNSIISKILLVYGVFSFLFLFGSYLIWEKQKDLLVESSNSRRERAELIFTNTVQSLTSQMTIYTYDYTYWDETVDFVRNPSKEWAIINLEETMPNFNVSFVWILNPNFELIYSHNVFNDTRYVKMPINKDVVREIITREKFPHFFFQTKDYLLEFSGAPIQRSADSNRVGTPYGYLFNARVWNENYIKILQQQSQSEILFILPKDYNQIERKYDPNTNPENIFAKMKLKDYKDNTLLYLCSVFTDDSLIEVRKNYNNYSTIWFTGGSITLVVILFLLNLWIFRPIKILSKSFSTGKTEGLVRLTKVDNVFGDYAKLFLNFLTQKRILEDEIKKREIAEKELFIRSSAVEQSPVSILIVEAEGAAEYVNPKFVETSGYTLDDLAGKKSFEFLSANPSEDFSKSIRSTVGKGSAWEGEILSKSKEGKTYWENVLVAPIKEENGKISRYVVLKEDITEKKRILNELISAKEAAEESSRMKEAFFTNMSHELRTPLIGILGFAEMIIDENSNERTVSKAQVIHKSGKRLLETLNNVLDLSKAKKNFDSMVYEEIELLSLVEESFGLFEQAAKQKGLSYNLFCDKTYNYFINADSYLLNSILNNLLSNAIKFTNSGKVELTLSDNGNNVTIDVSDTGIGIPKESTDLVFKEFRQVSEGIGRFFGGTGLGLSLVKKYTELLNGTISLKSSVGEGSTFCVTLPLLRKDKRK